MVSLDLHIYTSIITVITINATSCQTAPMAQNHLRENESLGIKLFYHKFASLPSSQSKGNRGKLNQLKDTAKSTWYHLICI